MTTTTFMPGPTVPPSADDRLNVFREYRPLLFSIAYRMLGSTAAADDVLQDAYLRWQRADASEVRSPRDYLSTTVTRLAIDHLRSAQVRREVYPGPWLPEPLVGIDERDPLAATELAESLSTAFMVLLERLSPRQRAAFLLREVFGFEYADVAHALQCTEASARQLVVRARQHLEAGRPRFSAQPRQADQLTRRFLDACAGGTIEGVLALLADDAVAWADGGGKFAAARRPVTGADRVARFVTSVVRKWRGSGEVRIASVSGSIGLVFHAGGRLRAVLSVAAAATGDRVDRVFIMVNPDKLNPSPPRQDSS
jgi:RNA polymerase sigma-70 factor, ECF subfamily